MGEIGEGQYSINRNVQEVKKEPPITKFKFVFCEHTPENAQKVVDALQDCDSIAIEAFGGSNQYREYMTNLANDITHGKLKGRDYKKALKQFRPNNYYGYSNGLDDSLLEAFKDSNKTITFIDASEEDRKAQELKKKIDETDKRFFELASRMPIHETKLLLRQRIKLWAAFGKHRDKLMTEQLKVIAEGWKVDKIPTTIGVVMGLGHYSSSTYVQQSGFDVSQIFVVDNENKTEKPEDSYFQQAIKTANEFPDKPIQLELLERVLLEYFVRHVTQELAEENYLQIVKLPDQEVRSLLQSIDKIISEHKGKNNRFRIANFILENPAFENLKRRKIKIGQVAKAIKYKINNP